MDQINSMPQNAINQQPMAEEGLTKREKIVAWVFSAINPVITGAVMYYAWRKSHPQKAKQANKISMICFLLWLLAWVLENVFIHFFLK